ncbi:class I tRNA ligase family protein, partial [Salmonella enterica subsp. enterica serovar Anatum]|nr:class I tRNA ligase family protein [Salmonella enterica subsp. enterica serovar Anatum]
KCVYGNVSGVRIPPSPPYLRKGSYECTGFFSHYDPSIAGWRHDWCISRQRTWGVPMSLFVHKETQELLPIERTLAAMEEVAKRV